MPETGRQFVIDNPECVKRTTPPTTTISRHAAATNHNQRSSQAGSPERVESITRREPYTVREKVGLLRAFSRRWRSKGM